MATAQYQIARYDPKDFPYVSEEEYEDYVESGMKIEKIKAISRKRQIEAEQLMDKFDPNRFPLLEETQFRKLVQEGNSLSKIDKINKSRNETLDKFRRQFSLKVNHEGFVPSTELSICMMGLSGEGKSATGNMILGEDMFLPGSDELQMYERSINGINAVVIEMPASEKSIDSPVWDTALARFGKGLNVFLFVVNISNHRDLARQTDIWNSLKQSHGIKFVSHCILVLTHAETTLLDQAPDLDTLYSVFIGDATGNRFGQVLHELHPRIIALDNKTQDPHKRRIQQELILDMVTKVSDYNRVPFIHYGMKLFDTPPPENPVVEEGRPEISQRSTHKDTVTVKVAASQLFWSIYNLFRR